MKRKGSPIKRYGGKGRLACFLVPHLARARIYAEPCFGAGSVFYRLPPGLYQREAVNDRDAAIVTFFKVLRDRPDELLRVCLATPYALDEFRAALAPAEDPLEEARRVWIRSRQSFSAVDPLGAGHGRWSRPTGRSGWRPHVNDNVLMRLPVDPPYVHSTRSGRNYRHEMSDDDHRRLGQALHAAVARGARVAISGYPCPLYDQELFPGWRRIDLDAAVTCARGGSQRATDSLWMSYPQEEELGHVPQLALELEGLP